MKQTTVKRMRGIACSLTEEKNISEDKQRLIAHIHTHNTR